MIDYVQLQYLSYTKVTQHKFEVVEIYKVTHLYGILREIIEQKLFPIRTPFNYNMTHKLVHVEWSDHGRQCMYVAKNFSDL